MATFTVQTTREQDDALEALLALRQKQGKPTTAADLIQSWAVHPINARLEEARQSVVIDRAKRIASLASAPPDVRAKADALEAELDALATAARANGSVR
jgi:hypothetical protein